MILLSNQALAAEQKIQEPLTPGTTVFGVIGVKVDILFCVILSNLFSLQRLEMPGPKKLNSLKSASVSSTLNEDIGIQKPSELHKLNTLMKRALVSSTLNEDIGIQKPSQPNKLSRWMKRASVSSTSNEDIGIQKPSEMNKLNRLMKRASVRSTSNAYIGIQTKLS